MLRRKFAYETDWELLEQHENDAMSAFASFMPEMLNATRDFYNDKKVSKSDVVRLISNLRGYQNLVENYFPEEALQTKLFEFATNRRDFSSKSELKAMRALASQFFQEGAVDLSRQSLRESIPQEILKFLPPRLTIEVDPDGKIDKISDFFANRKEDVDYKINQMKNLLSQYNKIVKKVESDLRSSDGKTRILATITAIIMETGIRPGGGDSESWAKDEQGRSMTREIYGPHEIQKDNKGNPVLDASGDYVLIDRERYKVSTFGAATLKGAHLNLYDSFATLKFVGKSSTTNLATISNKQVMEVLSDLAEKAKIRGGGVDFEDQFLFIDEDGDRIDADDLRAYFNLYFKGVKPNDFRKLRGTVALLERLQAERTSMRTRILKAIEDQVENVEEIATQAIVEALEKAVNEASVALNHFSGADVTIKNYLNPLVILNFLQKGDVAKDIREAVMYNPTEIVFDPRTFIENVAEEAYGKTASMKRRASCIRGVYRFASLGDILEELENERLGSLGDLLEDLANF